MYESHFALQQRPFAASPAPEHFLSLGSIEQAKKTLIRCIERASGPGVVIGPAGTGKTLLCQVLAETFRSSFRVVMLASARLCSRRALLQNILFELNLPYRGMEEGELRLSLIDHLEPSEKCPNGMLLLADEADCLPLRLLEEIRMITNLVREGKPRVRLVLAGAPALEERFASPKLESFNQRLAARCYLQSLGRDETVQYVRGQITMAGGKPDRLFTSDALDAVHVASDGIPRLINQLCDHALLLASLGGAAQLTAEGIQEAWSDLQQLPTTWQSSSGSKAQPQSAVVEFGSLDETADEGGSQPDPDPQVQLDRLERQVADVSTPAMGAADQEDFEPVGMGPEIELIFHGPHNPFAEEFADEEIVIDHYASIDAKTRTQTVVAAPPPSSGEQDVTDVVLNPASDPVMPEYPHLSETEIEAIIPPHRSPHAPPADDKAREPLAPVDSRLRVAHPDDDRDLIVFQDEREKDGQHATTPVGSRKYGQLFAKLRRG